MPEDCSSIMHRVVAGVVRQLVGRKKDCLQTLSTKYGLDAQ